MGCNRSNPIALRMANSGVLAILSAIGLIRIASQRQFKKNGYIFMGNKLFLFYLPSHLAKPLKEGEQIIFFTSRSHCGRVLWSMEVNWKSLKLLPVLEMAKNHTDNPFTLNEIQFIL